MILLYLNVTYLTYDSRPVFSKEQDKICMEGSDFEWISITLLLSEIIYFEEVRENSRWKKHGVGTILGLKDGAVLKIKEDYHVLKKDIQAQLAQINT